MKGTTEALREMVKAEAGSKIEPELHDFYIADNLAKWEKRKTLCGNGQCPVLPQAASGAPKTKFWVKGPLVKGNSKVPRGTIIATFDENDRYANKSHGNHAAIYLEQTAKGLVVLDQWAGRDVEKNGFKRTIVFGYSKTDIVNDGNYFYVVLTPKLITMLFMIGEEYEAHA